MRKFSGALFAALFGLLFAIGADGPTRGAKSMFLVYSSDERSELAPCG